MIGSCTRLPAFCVARVSAGCHIGWKPRQTRASRAGALKSFVKKRANKNTKAKK